MNKLVNPIAPLKTTPYRAAAFRMLALTLALGWGLSCATTEAPRFATATGPVYYTQVNIRYVNPQRIPSTNYLRGDMLPVGTPVRIVDRGMRAIRFVDPSNREYALAHVAKHTEGTLDNLFHRTFSREDPWAPGGALDRLPPDTVAHIEKGTVGGGMTREAVLMAYGYPPSHRTRSLESDVWTYWTGRTRTQLVFRDGRLFQADDAVLPHTIRLFAVSDPPGAVVESEGQFRGKTPCMLTVTVDPSQPQRLHTFRAVPARPDAPRFGVLASAPSAGAAVGDTIVVKNVLPLSTAHRMGMRSGDRILSINGAQVRNESECAEIIASVGFGAPLTVVVQRNGKETTLTGKTETPEQGTFHARNETLSAARLMDMHDRVLFFDLKTEPVPDRSRTPVAPHVEKEDIEAHVVPPADDSPVVPPAGDLTVLGTGVVVANGGYVVTSAALIKDRSRLTVRTVSGAEHAAEVVRSDPGNDWALLRADGLESDGVPIGSDRLLRRGARIVCLGFVVDPATGQATPDVQAREGTILDLTGLSEDTRHMQLALPIGGGYSGSPALDETGAWIGLVSDSLNGIIHAVAPPGSVLPGTTFVLKASLVEPALPTPVRERIVRRDDKAPALTTAQLKERMAESVVMIRQDPVEN